MPSTRWLRVAALVLLPAQGLAAPPADAPPPDWLARGAEAALADPKDGAAAVVTSAWAGPLLPDLARGLGHDAIIDRLLPLLAGPEAGTRIATAELLAAIPPGDRASAVIDRLLPMLAAREARVVQSAAEALAMMPLDDRGDAVTRGLLAALGPSHAAMRTAVETALAASPASRQAGIRVAGLLLLAKSDRGVLVPPPKGALVRSPVVSDEAAGAAIDGLLLPLLGAQDPVAQAAAVRVLGIIVPAGARAGTAIDRLLPLLHSADWQLPSEIAETLAAIAPGVRAGAVVDALLPLLTVRNTFEQLGVLRALAAIPPGDRAGAVVDRMLDLLRAQTGYGVDVQVMAAALDVLARIPLGARMAEVVNTVFPLCSQVDGFNDEAGDAAARVLAAVAARDGTGSVTDWLLQQLSAPRAASRAGAALALAAVPLGDRTALAVDQTVPLLGSPYVAVQAIAATALGRMPLGGRAGPVIDALIPLLRSADWTVQDSAVRALGAIAPGDRRDAVIDALLGLLRGPEYLAGDAVAQALAGLPLSWQDAAIIDTTILTLANQFSASPAMARVLQKAGPGRVSSVLVVLAAIHDREVAATPALRAAAHLATGADAHREGSETLLAWLGRPAAPPIAAITNHPDRAYPILELFKAHWPEIAANPALRDEAEGRIMDIVYSACRAAATSDDPGRWLNAGLNWLRDLPMRGPGQRCWTSTQRPVLDALLAGFQEAHSAYATSLAEHLARERAAPILQFLTWGIAGWLLFWAAFLFAFPWSRSIQAVFFWNPKVRSLLSLWFVPLLLFLLPPMRRRLLAPFRGDLLAAARLADLPRLGFFGQIPARLGDGKPVPVEALLPGLRGAIVLRGEAGCGKTSALRWMASRAARPVAFLAAADCAAGVDVAIARLIRDVQETGFVRSMVHAGALMVIIDGLNEVSADTREKIGAFASDMSKGDVLVGTQPIEWLPPPGARTVDLLPLDRADAKRFLMTRPGGADAALKLYGAAYGDAVLAFLRRALDEAPTDEDRAAAELVLSNPFDLTFAADLLAQGSMPAATAVIDAAFRLADDGAPGEPGYRAVAGQPFPLVPFGRKAVEMRLEDRNWFKADEFAAELPFLQRRRLLVRRAVRGAAGVEERNQFRHDRVWDFFIAAAFLADPDLWERHLADPRFRGAYLRIAETWDPNAAALVRDRMVVVAAERGDHTTSDEFVRRLESRRRRKTTPTPPGAIAMIPAARRPKDYR